MAYAFIRSQVLVLVSILFTNTENKKKIKKWKCSRERERNISILTILHLSFLISNMKLFIIHNQTTNLT